MQSFRLWPAVAREDPPRSTTQSRTPFSPPLPPQVNLEEIEADARKMLAGHSSAFREARRRGKEDEGGGPGGTAVAGAREGPEWRGAGLPPLDSPTDTAADTPRSSVTPEPGASRASTAQSYRPGTHLRERFLQKASEAAALLGDDDFGATGFVDAASVEERLDELRRRRAELEQESRAADGAQDGGDGTGAETAGWSVQGDSPASEAGRPLSRPGDSTPNWDTQSYSSAGGSQYEPYRHPSASAPPARQVSAIGSIETDIPHLTTEEARLIMDARAAKEAAVRRAIAAMRAAEEEAERSRVAVARREMAVAEAAADATPLFAATRDAAERAMRQEQDGDRRRSAPVTDASGALLPRHAARSASPSHHQSLALPARVSGCTSSFGLCILVFALVHDAHLMGRLTGRRRTRSRGRRGQSSMFLPSSRRPSSWARRGHFLISPQCLSLNLQLLKFLATPTLIASALPASLFYLLLAAFGDREIRLLWRMAA